MTRYLISFDEGAMTFPAQDLPDIARAARAVVEVSEPRGGVRLDGTGEGYPDGACVGSGTIKLFDGVDGEPSRQRPSRPAPVHPPPIPTYRSLGPRR